MRSVILTLFATLAASACAPPEAPDRDVGSAASALSQFGIEYWGGPVLSGPTVYVIWYGTWNRPIAMSTINDFLAHVGGTPYWSIHSTYTGQNNLSVSSALALAPASVHDSYSVGHTLRAENNDLQHIVSRALASGLHYDPAAIYLVMGDSDVTMELDGLPNGGFHGVFAPPGVPPVTIAWVRYSPGVIWGGPNGDGSLDAAVDVISHELSEATLDPQPGSGWFDGTGAEDADKCASPDFGPAQYEWSSGGGWANLHVGSHDFLVQTLWVNGPPNGYCAMQPLADVSMTVNGSGSIAASRPDYGGTSASSGSRDWLYFPGTQVTYTATPSAGSVAARWSGCDSVGSAGSNVTTCTITAGGPATSRAVAANFNPACNHATCLSACRQTCVAEGGRPIDCAAECNQDCASCH